MPWEQVRQSGPRSWAESVSGRHSKWIEQWYVPISRQGLEKELQEISGELQQGNILLPSKKLEALQGELDKSINESINEKGRGEVRLCQGVQKIAELLQEAAGIESALQKTGLKARQKLAEFAQPAIEQAKLLPYVYYDLSESAYLLLSLVYLGQRMWLHNSWQIIEKMREPFKSKIAKHFDRAITEQGIHERTSHFYQLIISIGELASEHVGQWDLKQQKISSFQTLGLLARVQIDESGHLPEFYVTGEKNDNFREYDPYVRYGKVIELNPDAVKDWPSNILFQLDTKIYPNKKPRIFSPAHYQRRIYLEHIKELNFVPLGHEPKDHK